MYNRVVDIGVAVIEHVCLGRKLATLNGRHASFVPQSIIFTHLERMQATFHCLWQPSLGITAWVTTPPLPCPKPTSKQSVNNSQHLSVAPISTTHSDLPKKFSKYLTSRNPQTSQHSLSTPIPEMAPPTTAIGNHEPSSATDTLSATWCIPFLAFYAFGILASMTMLWAAAKFSNRPLWPPACFHNRSGFLYQTVLYFPALLWLAVLAVGILCLLGCGLLHLWKWLVRKLSSACGRAGNRDGVLLRRQTDGVGRVPLTPVGDSCVDTNRREIVQVEQETKSITAAEKGIPRSTLGSQEVAVHTHQVSTAGKNTRQEPGEAKE